jgi:hypothetical protein
VNKISLKMVVLVVAIAAAFLVGGPLLWHAVVAMHGG